MKRMKTFFIYLLIFVAFYFASNYLISAYIKASHNKISSYEIDVKEATVTIISAKASKDGGNIEGKIFNNTEDEILNKYLKVELFAENNVSLGTEYAKIDLLLQKDLKDFNIMFNYDNVKTFKITMIDEEEKTKLDQERSKSIINFNTNPKVDNIIDGLENEMKEQVK